MSNTGDMVFKKHSLLKVAPKKFLGNGGLPEKVDVPKIIHEARRKK